MLLSSIWMHLHVLASIYGRAMLQIRRGKRDNLGIISHIFPVKYRDDSNEG